MTLLPRRGTRALTVLVSLACLGSAAAALAADVNVSYSHRVIPNGNPPPPGFTEGNVLATFTGSETIHPTVPDPELVQLSPSQWQYSFAWDWTAAKSVEFVTASAETILASATPSPLWTLDPARHALPVLSVQTDSTSLWPADTGIYVWGNAINFIRRGSEWERVANLEWYGTDDQLAFSEPIGLRIHGGQSRFFDQKGLRFYFDDYGTEDELTFDAFDDGGPSTFERLILRQARRPFFAINETFAGGIFDDLGHLRSRERFIVAYLNGEYWGAYNLRERYDSKFFEVTHGFPKDEYIVVKDGEEEEGDIQVWWSDLDWFGTSTEPESHAWFVEAASRIDLDSYIDWLLINIYCAAGDNGFDHNVAQLKVQGEPWRFLMWDEDSILFDANLAANHFRFYAAADQAEYTLYKPILFPWPWTPAQQRWCTMFDRFLRNPEFRARFFNRAQELLAAELSVPAMEARLDAIAAVQQAEMTGDHVGRWGEGPISYPDEIVRAKGWLAARKVHIDLQLPPFYERYAQPVELSAFSASAGIGGAVDLTWQTEREIDNQGFVVLRGEGSPDNLVAIASWETVPALVGAGTSSLPTQYAWTDPSPPTGSILYYVLRHVDTLDSATTHPWVEAVDRRDWTGLVLNEVGANNAGLVLDGLGDADPWLELANTGASTVQLDSLWLSTDPATPQMHQMVGAITLAAGETLLLWADGEPGEGATHVNVTLNPTGGEVSLYLPDGATLLDMVPYAEQFPDRSYARWPSGSGTWSYAFLPTPGNPNVAPELERFLVLNEVQTDNATTLLDELSEADPWVEIANPLPVPVALDGLELTATAGAVTGWALPDSALAGDGYQVVWVDAETSQGAWHADFAPAVGGGFVGLVRSADSVVVDSVTVVSPGTDWAVARVPDAFGPWTAWDTPTPGAFNPAPAPVLFLNEFLASNESGITDEGGDREDWVEIYNPNAFPVDVGGMHLTDNLANPLAWQFPSAIVQPMGFLIVWCDDEIDDGPLHATFKLGSGGEDLGLFGGAVHGFVEIDSYTFGPQTDDVSEGRENDGSLPWVFLNPPSPGSPNGPVTGAPALPADPAELALLPAAPNPFRHGSRIRFVTPRAGHLQLDLFDVAGRRIARLAEGPVEPGPGTVVWDGRDSAGRRVSSGVYFVRLNVSGETRTGRLVRLR